MKIKRELILSGMLFLLGCLTDNEIENPKALVNNKYTDNTSGISIQFPAAWSCQLNYQMGTATMDIVGGGPPVNSFSPNISVYTSPHTGTSDMAAVLAGIKPQLQAQLPNINFVGDTVYVKEATAFGELVYTLNVGGNDLKYKQLLFINREMDILITITDKTDHFDLNAEFVQIQKSLTVF